MRSWRRRMRSGSNAGTRAGAVSATALLHGAVLAVMWAAPATLRSTPPIYSVELVAAPRSEPEARRAPEAVQRPAERPAPLEERRPRRTTVAETPPPPAPEPEVEREPAPRQTPDVELAPGEEPSTGTDPATVKTKGIPFPFPGYLENVVAQVYRRWNRPKGNVSLRAEVMFFIHRDGSISNLRFVQRSGSFAFDLEAQGAIEAAANTGAFGPLPEGYEADVLPVSFFFDPQTARR